MMMDSKGFISAIVGKVAPKGDGEGEEEKGEGMSEGLLTAAEDVLDVLDPYGAPRPSEPGDGRDETPLQKQQREIDRRADAERRRAKAEILAQALKAFCDLAAAE